jgi:predicted AlkP superfamily phosphohydrolase/phosphomutase
MNRQGREPQGVIADADYPAVRAELAAQLKAMPGANGEPLNTHVFFPEDIYQQVNGVAPDMIVYFGDLHWRTVGTLGYEQHFTLENDTGPDDANHSPEGMFILYEPGRKASGKITGQQLMNIAPTLLHRFKLPIPKAMQGTVIEI